MTKLVDFRSGSAKTRINLSGISRPSIFPVRDTKMEFAFECEAFGDGNRANRTWPCNTVWLISEAEQPGRSLANELFHVIADNGEQSIENTNQNQTGQRPAQPDTM